MAKAFQTDAFQTNAFQSPEAEQNVGQGAIAVTGTLVKGLVRLLYATVGGAYRTFKEHINKYRKFKQGGDYRRFKE